MIGSRTINVGPAAGQAGCEPPLLTILTASYNAIGDLRQTISSVAHAAKSLRCEHIVIDGGSGDGTREYLETLGDAVRWVSEPDDGIADALNKGIAMARGEWVLVLQAGDRFLHDHSARFALRHLGGDLVCFGVSLGDRIAWAHGSRMKREFFMTAPHQGTFVRLSAYARWGTFDPRFKIAMDYEWLLRATRGGASLRVVREPISFMAPGGISSRTDWNGLAGRLSENRAAQTRHARGPLHRLVLSAFWLLYLPYKRMLTLTRRTGRPE